MMRTQSNTTNPSSSHYVLQYLRVCMNFGSCFDSQLMVHYQNIDAVEPTLDGSVLNSFIDSDTSEARLNVFESATRLWLFGKTAGLSLQSIEEVILLPKPFGNGSVDPHNTTRAVVQFLGLGSSYRDLPSNELDRWCKHLQAAEGNDALAVATTDWSFEAFWKEYPNRILAVESTHSNVLSLSDLRSHCFQQLLELLASFVNVPIHGQLLRDDANSDLRLSTKVKDALASCVCADRSHANQELNLPLLTSMLLRLAAFKHGFDGADKSTMFVASRHRLAKMLNARICSVRQSLKHRKRKSAAVIEPGDQLEASDDLPTSELLVPLRVKRHRMYRMHAAANAASQAAEVSMPTGRLGSVNSISQFELDCFSRVQHSAVFFKYDKVAKAFLSIPVGDLDWLTDQSPIVHAVLELNRHFHDDRPDSNTESHTSRGWNAFHQLSRRDSVDNASEALVSGSDQHFWVGFSHTFEASGLVWALSLTSMPPPVLSWRAAGELREALSTHSMEIVVTSSPTYWSPAHISVRMPSPSKSSLQLPQALRTPSRKMIVQHTKHYLDLTASGASSVVQHIAHSGVDTESAYAGVGSESPFLDLAHSEFDDVVFIPTPAADNYEFKHTMNRTEGDLLATAHQVIALPAAAAPSHTSDSAIRYQISFSEQAAGVLFHPRSSHAELWEFVLGGLVALEVGVIDWCHRRKRWIRPFTGTHSCWLNSYVLFLFSLIHHEEALLCGCIRELVAQIHNLDASNVPFCDEELFTSLVTLGLVGAAVEACSEDQVGAQTRLDRRLGDARSLSTNLEAFNHRAGFACPMQTHDHVVRGIMLVLELQPASGRSESRLLAEFQRTFGVFAFVRNRFRLQQDALHAESRIPVAATEKTIQLNQVLSKALDVPLGGLEVLRLPKVLVISIEPPTTVSFKRALTETEAVQLEQVQLLALWTFSSDHYITYLGNSNDTVADVLRGNGFSAARINNLGWTAKSRVPSPNSYQTVDNVSFLLFHFNDSFHEDKFAQHTFISPVIFRTPQNDEPLLLQGAQPKRRRKAATSNLRMQVHHVTEGSINDSPFPGYCTYSNASDFCGVIPPWLVRSHQLDMDITEAFSAHALTTLCAYLNECCSRGSLVERRSPIGIYFAPWWLLSEPPHNVRWTQRSNKPTIDTSNLLCLPHVDKGGMMPMGFVFVDVPGASVAYYDISTLRYSDGSGQRELARAAIMICQKYLKVTGSEWRFMIPHSCDHVYIRIESEELSKSDVVHPQQERDLCKQLIFVHILVACTQLQHLGLQDVLPRCSNDGARLLANNTNRCAYQSLMWRCHTATSLQQSHLTISDLPTFYQLQAELHSFRNESKQEFQPHIVHKRLGGKLPIETTRGPILVPVGVDDIKGMLGCAQSGFVHGSGVEAYLSSLLHLKQEQKFRANSPTLQQMLAKCAFVSNDFTFAQDFQYTNDGTLCLMDMSSDLAVARQRALTSSLKNGLQGRSSLEYSGVCAVLANANHFILAHINPLQKNVRIYDSMRASNSISTDYKTQILYLCYLFQLEMNEAIDDDGRPWTLQVQNSPQQDNSLDIFDCAIFSVWNLLTIEEGRVPFMTLTPGAVEARRWLIRHVISWCETLQGQSNQK